MKAMFAGFAAAILIAVAANVILGELGFSTAERLSAPSVRLN